MNINTPFAEYHQTSKNNLIQNFYIIGLSLNEFFKVDPKEKSGEFADIFKENIEDIPKLTPKIITKFPDIKNSLNKIPDEIVIDHCFPNGILKVFQKPKVDNPKTFFQFELDNIPQIYQNDEQKIYSKIYFTCLEIGESISDYFQYKKEIINLIFKYKSIEIKNFDKNIPEGIDINKKFSNFMIPKVICFASVLPFYNELSLLLKSIYDYYLSKSDFSTLPLEKIIEKIIIETPIPLKIGNELSIIFKTSNYKEKITFPLLNINEVNIKYSNNMSLVDIFKNFSLEEIIRIFKYIIYEIPLLFFCENKSILSLLINTFLSVLSPFKYVFPHISMLPKKIYGLINSEQKFIFGINENYNENFFKNNNIELDKTIVIININVLDQSKKNAKVNIEEKIFDINNYDKLIIERKGLLNRYEDTILINGNITHIINVDIPNVYKKILSEGISKYISFMKKKNFFTKKDSIPKDFTFKIQNTFYKFFVNVMYGYTEFLHKSSNFYSKPRNIGEKMYFRREHNFLKEVFNSEEFISKVPKDCQPFYVIFFKTKLFENFFYERIYSNNILEQIALRQFDQLIFLKKHNEFRKKKENKNYYENFKKDVFDKIKAEKKEEISIFEDNTFSNKEILSLVTDEEKNTDILLNYGQLIKVKSSNYINQKEKNNKDNYSKLVDINYCIFPRLLFECLDKKSTNLIFLKDDYINSFKTICTTKKQELEKIRPYLLHEKLLDKINYSNNSNTNYIIYHSIYIQYIWSILISCCLWYCENDERNYRLDKLFEVINKIEHFEEYVLDILFYNIYNYGDKFHLIKMYMLYIKIKGNISYYFLSLLCNKIKEKENDEVNIDNMIEEEQNDLILSKRYLIKLSNEFSQKRKSKLMRQSFISEDNEEIIFLTEQKCIKCYKTGKIDFVELINNKNNLNEKIYKYKCPFCQNENQDINIKYQILIFNYKKKEAFITETGEFLLLTPYRLYEDLKNYLIEENNLLLEIKNILDIKEKINLINILFYFNVINYSFDFLLPYVPRLNSSMKLFFENTKSQQNKILEKKVNEPIRITYQDETSFVYRKFNTITPLFNVKKKSSIFGLAWGGFPWSNTKYVETELSFTIKNSKKKGKK